MPAAQRHMRRRVCWPMWSPRSEILVRPARIHPRQPWLLAPRQLAIAAAVYGCRVPVRHDFFRRRRDQRGRASAALGDHTAFDAITDFGKSGWFLWPLGILFLALAALPQNLTRMSQRVLAAVMVRVGFLFIAIGCAWPVREHRQAHHRAGAAARRRHRRSVSVQSVRLGVPPMPACRPAMRPRRSRCWWPSASLWPRARTDPADLCAADRGEPGRGDGALSDRRGGRRPGRGRRRADGAPLFRAARLLGFSVGPDGSVRTIPGPSLKRIKSVARELLA